VLSNYPQFDKIYRFIDRRNIKNNDFKQNLSFDIATKFNAERLAGFYLKFYQDFSSSSRYTIDDTILSPCNKTMTKATWNSCDQSH